MTPSQASRLRGGLLLLLVVGMAGAALSYWFGSEQNPLQPTVQGRDRPPALIRDRWGEVEVDVKSDYSRIRIRKADNVRSLWFVRDSGEEVIESIVDLDKPHELLVDYTRFMFLSYLFRPKQEKVLIVGLGGGAMIHFINHYDAKLKTDVVEIDPTIVKFADKYFNVRTGGNVNVVTTDGFEYLKKTESRYDVIYMDAFLKPSGNTDETGVPLRLKTIQFYKEVQKKLVPDGMVVFNINPHSMIDDDVKNIRDAFPQTYVFQLPNSEGLVVVGSLAERRVELPALLNRAAELDRRFKTTYSYQDMTRSLAR